LYFKHSLFFIRYSERSRIWSEIQKHGRDGTKSQGRKNKENETEGWEKRTKNVTDEQRNYRKEKRRKHIPWEIKYLGGNNTKVAKVTAR
jgi:hypothetical protein